MKEKRVTTPLHEHGVRIGGDEERKRARAAKCGVKKKSACPRKRPFGAPAPLASCLPRVERGLKDAGLKSRAPGWERGERFSRVVDIRGGAKQANAGPTPAPNDLLRTRIRAPAGARPRFPQEDGPPPQTRAAMEMTTLSRALKGATKRDGKGRKSATSEQFSYTLASKFRRRNKAKDRRTTVLYEKLENTVA